MTSSHSTISRDAVDSLTPDELRDYRSICRRFIGEQGPVGWAYQREVDLLLTINSRLAYLGQ